MFYDHSGIKLESTSGRKLKKHTNMWKLNNMLLTNQQIKEEIKQDIKKAVLKQMKMKTQLSKIYRMQQKQF